MSADRNFLFGILAVQLDFISQDALMGGMHAWQLDKARPLGDILRDRGDLLPGRLQLLEALVAEHLRQHGDDPTQSLSALSSVEPIKRTLEWLADAGGQGTLPQVGANAGSNDTPSPVATSVRYRILRPHARGGLGEVYVAEDTEFGRHVALKEIQDRWADHADSRGRFVLEAEITGGLEHPGIVPVYGLGTYSDGRPFYAMRFIQGDNLQETIKRFHDPASGVASAPRETSEPGALTQPRSPNFASLEFRDLVRRFVDVCNAVAYAHSRGVLHRDLKPGNVMLGRYGETLVVDWGLAKATGRAGSVSDRSDGPLLQPRSGGDSSATVAGQALGTPAYMSPEQAAGRLADLGPATDVYSLGATLYELLTGRVPITGSSVGELLEAVQAGRFPPPRAVRAAVPAALEAVCLKAMALRPGERYGSALELAADLDRWLADEPVSAYREPRRERLRRWLRKHRTASAVVAVGLVAASGLFASVALLTEVARRRSETEQAETARQRGRAEGNLRKVAVAIDRMLTRVGDERLAKVPHFDAERRAILTDAIALYRELSDENDADPVVRRETARAQVRLGRLHYLLGNLAEARDVFERARVALAAIEAESGSTLELRTDLARANDGFAIAVLRLADDRGIEEDLLPFARTDRRRGFPAGRQVGSLSADHRTASEHFQRSLAIWQSLIAEDPSNVEYRGELATVSYRLACAYAWGRQPAEGERQFERTVGYLADFVRAAPSLPKARAKLGSAHMSCGAHYLRSGQWAAADAHYRAGLVQEERLADERHAVLEDLGERAYALHALGLLAHWRGDAGGAIGRTRRALAERRQMAADHPLRAELVRDVQRSRMNLGYILAAPGRPADGLAELSPLADELTAEVRAKADDDTARLFLGYAERGRAEVLARLGRTADARTAWARAAEFTAPRDRPILALETALALGDDVSAALAELTEPDLKAEAACLVVQANGDAAMAMALLRSATRAGNLGPLRLPDPGYRDELAPLRGRADYAELVWAVADGVSR